MRAENTRTGWGANEVTELDGRVDFREGLAKGE